MRTRRESVESSESSPVTFLRIRTSISAALTVLARQLDDLDGTWTLHAEHPATNKTNIAKG